MHPLNINVHVPLHLIHGCVRIHVIVVISATSAFSKVHSRVVMVAHRPLVQFFFFSQGLDSPFSCQHKICSVGEALNQVKVAMLWFCHALPLTVLVVTVQQALHLSCCWLFKDLFTCLSILRSHSVSFWQRDALISTCGPRVVLGFQMQWTFFNSLTVTWQ